MLGRDFLGPDEINAIAGALGVADPGQAGEVPAIPFDQSQLHRLRSTHLLLLGSPSTVDGAPLTIARMRAFWGTDPSVREPCFYNQDWYVREAFANRADLEPRWYLVAKDVEDRSRGRDPDELASGFADGERFPSALLACYVFFAYYLHTGGDRLWKHSFIWCSDLDHNGDRIYVGRYCDPDGVNKNGFNVHRHLRIRPAYGAATEIAAQA
jgi:hypothetical protein